jgi:hypothetical protein
VRKLQGGLLILGPQGQWDERERHPNAHREGKRAQEKVVETYYYCLLETHHYYQ